MADFKPPFKSIDSISDTKQQQISKDTKNLTSDSNNVVKLSIQDYKRKLQKPNADEFSNQKQSLDQYSYSYNHQQQQQHQQKIDEQLYLPRIPSYASNITNPLIEITPPQCKSLHELLKNFPS